MFKKINLITIISGLFFVFLVTTGTKRIHLSTQSEIFKAINNKDTLKYEELTDLRPSELMFQHFLWPLFFAMIAVGIVFLFNWRTNKSLINSVIVLLLGFILFPTGMINGHTIPIFFNSFCYLLSPEMGTAFLIGELILCVVGILILFGGDKLSAKIIDGEKTNQFSGG